MDRQDPAQKRTKTARRIAGFQKTKWNQSDFNRSGAAHPKGMPLLLVVLCSPCVYFIEETISVRHTTTSESGAFLACLPAASQIASASLLHGVFSVLQIIGAVVIIAAFTWPT